MTVRLADRTMTGIFDAMPAGEWVSARDVWDRLEVGSVSAVKHGLADLAKEGKIEARVEDLLGNATCSFYWKPTP